MLVLNWLAGAAQPAYEATTPIQSLCTCMMQVMLPAACSSIRALKQHRMSLALQPSCTTAFLHVCAAVAGGRRSLALPYTMTCPSQLLGSLQPQVGTMHAVLDRTFAALRFVDHSMPGTKGSCATPTSNHSCVSQCAHWLAMMSHQQRQIITHAFAQQLAIVHYCWDGVPAFCNISSAPPLCAQTRCLC
jgi:hypothetical protein